MDNQILSELKKPQNVKKILFLYSLNKSLLLMSGIFFYKIAFAFCMFCSLIPAINSI